MCYARKNLEKRKAWKSEKLRIALLSPNGFGVSEKARGAKIISYGWGAAAERRRFLLS